MKTVVFGLFDDSRDAARVLDQLANSPLDLETVSVVHQDAAMQEALASEAGLPKRRTVQNGLIVGALAGAALGAVAGGGVLAVLGPLLATGVGALAGGLLVGAAAVILDAPRVPDPLANDLVDALASGKTLLSVRTNNLATARAIRDLFEAGGSELLGPPPPMGVPGSSAIPDASAIPPDTAPVGSDAAPEAAAAHDLFAPPWRRTPFGAGPRHSAGLEDGPEAEPSDAPSRTQDAP